MFFHHFRLAEFVRCSCEMVAKRQPRHAMPLPNGWEHRKLLAWRSVLFADAAVTAITAIVSHQITFFLLLLLVLCHSHGPAYAHRTSHTDTRSVCLNLNLWLFAFFTMLLLCLKFYHFNVFAMNFHAIICLCSKPESERVIALLLPLCRSCRRRCRCRLHRRNVDVVFFMDFLDWNKRSWNYEQNTNRRRRRRRKRRMKIVNERMRINGGWRQEHTLNRSILSFRPHA